MGFLTNYIRWHQHSISHVCTAGTGGSSDTIADYFSQLTQSEVAALFRKYQLDFELYGYDPEPYFDIVMVDPPMVDPPDES